MMGRKHLWTTTILINQGSNFGDVDMTILSEQNGRVVEKKINDINDNSAASNFSANQKFRNDFQFYCKPMVKI